MKLIRETSRDGVTTVLVFSNDEEAVLAQVTLLARIAQEITNRYKGNGVSERAINVLARLQADASTVADGIEVDWERHPESDDA